MKSFNIGIVGAGALGSALAYRLHQRQKNINAIVSRNGTSAKFLARKVHCTLAGNDLRLLENCHIIIIAVPDSETNRTLERLRKIIFNFRSVILIHTSGAISSDVRSSVYHNGRSKIFTAGMHPMQSFPRKIKWTKEILNDHFENIYFGVEGHPRSLPTVKSLVRKLGSQFIMIPAAKKTLYHLGGVVSSNFFVALTYTASQIYSQIGLSEKQTLELLYPILRRTLENTKKFGTIHSLTGPASRNDRITIEQHMKALKSFDKNIQNAYRSLTAICYTIAKQR